jgi:predicted double-glycine peptidase
VQDLLIGVLIIGLISSLLLVASMRAALVLPPRLTNLLAIFLITMMVAFVFLLQGRIELSRVLPFSNLIMIGNWQPLIAAVFAGLIWRRLPAAMWRRTLVIAALVASCIYGIYEPVLGRTPHLSDRWLDNICLQTSPASCTPAAAATLLTSHGIRATEQEMAMLCLTTTKGTSFHGLYRGLKLKTTGTPWDVYMFSDSTIDDLRRMAGPVLISVELRPELGLDPRYQNTFGWLPGVAHTVMLIDFVHGDLVRIADPAVGHEVWNLDDLRLLWHGEGATLVRAKQ